MQSKSGLETYRRLKQQHPDYFGAVEALGVAVRQAGPLDEQQIQLIPSGAAAAIRSAPWSGCAAIRTSPPA